MSGLGNNQPLLAKITHQACDHGAALDEFTSSALPMAGAMSELSWAWMIAWVASQEGSVDSTSSSAPPTMTWAQHCPQGTTGPRAARRASINEGLAWHESADATVFGVREGFY